MKYCYYSCLLIGQLICCTAEAQFYFSSGNKPEPELLWELGGSAGGMNCLTDIGGHNGQGKKFIKDINWNKTRLCGSLFLSATWQSTVAVRLEATMGQVNGDDQTLKNSSGDARNRYHRNLHFRSTVAELILLAELHLLALNKTSDLPLLSPYLAAGAGIFHYNPQARLHNTWVDLRPLHTEGEGFTEYPARTGYKATSWCIPVGAGIKYDAGNIVNFRFELLYRFTGTDYLDDVSNGYIDPSLFSKYLPATQSALAEIMADRSADLPGGRTNTSNTIRGNPANRDAYFSCLFKIGIALGRIPRK